jgi:Secretion system C-terminal sorting domain
LVLNPSFENKINCPIGPADIQQVIGWNTFRESPDYFHSCGAAGVKVPNNSYGYQNAATGNAYVGIICFNNSILSREIISDSLITPLSVGQKYFLSFMVNRAGDTSITGYSTNKMGAKFSTVKLMNCTINNAAHFYSNSVISDSINWTKLNGSFIADSAYQYLMIGNFFDDSNTTFINNGTGVYSYYYIDDVCLSTDSLLCAEFSTEIQENELEKDVLIYPNPSSSMVSVKCPYTFNLRVYDKLGKEMFHFKKAENEITIDISKWEEGVYVAIINGKAKKIIINR